MPIAVGRQTLKEDLGKLLFPPNLFQHRCDATSVTSNHTTKSVNRKSLSNDRASLSRRSMDNFVPLKARSYFKFRNVSVSVFCDRFSDKLIKDEGYS